MRYLLILLFFPLYIFAQQPVRNDLSVVDRMYYSIGFNKELKQSEWVYYKSYKSLKNGTQKRFMYFIEDISYSNNQYKYSSYDRGHLCPANDMKGNYTAMKECFYLSNISPQDPQFNRGIWKQLEWYVHNLPGDTLYITTGPVFNKKKKVVSEMYIPDYFYKIVYIKPNTMIAFMLPNKQTNKSIFNFLTTVDKIEIKTGINFYPGIDNEDILESTEYEPTE